MLVVDACVLVDELEPDLVGELVLEGDAGPLGSVYVQHRSICWVAARGLARRLVELLDERFLQQVTRAPATLEGELRRCLASGVPFTQDLLARGMMSSADLRAALLAHSAESLRRMCEPSRTTRWRPRQQAFDARFTFSTTELWCRANVAAMAGPGGRAEISLSGMVGFEGDWAAAFVRLPGHAAPQLVGLAGAYPERASIVLGAARWAASTLDVRAALGAEDGLILEPEDGADDLCMTTFPAPWIGPGAFVVGQLRGEGAELLVTHYGRPLVESAH